MEFLSQKELDDILSEISADDDITNNNHKTLPINNVNTIVSEVKGVANMLKCKHCNTKMKYVYETRADKDDSDKTITGLAMSQQFQKSLRD